MHMNLRYTKQIIQCWPVVIVGLFRYARGRRYIFFNITFLFCIFLSYRPIPLAAGLGRSQGEEQGQGLRPQEVRLGPQQGKEFNSKN
jgi:hypothetical protein